MAAAKSLKTNPRELAGKIITEILRLNLDKNIEKVEEKNGFINFYLSREFFSSSVKEILELGENFGKNDALKGKKIMIEYTDPNPFKPFHIGHLMTNAIGESVARIFEFSGAVVARANYQGDVGLHIAKAFYGMQKKGMPQDMSAPVQILAQYIGDSYVLGSTAYDEDPEVKKEIDILNKKIYARDDKEVNEVYDWGFKVTMEAFEDLYKILGTKFDFYFLESQMAQIGLDIVQNNTGKVFEDSDGAVVFKAEKYDPKLHTRVFITSAGLPTYETKELGLTVEKFKTDPDMYLSIVVTANEQADYMRVVAKAISLIHPEFEKRMQHITHGMMRLATGKMGSRKGNVVTGESLIRDSINIVNEKIKDRDFSEAERKTVSEKVGVSALKYSILRSSIGSDIVYDFEKSISFDGDSGPYLQYSTIRAKSVLEKAENQNISHKREEFPNEVSNLEKILYRFPEIVAYSHQELEPHHIATYLTVLASDFNSFYAQTKIIDAEDKYSPYYLDLTTAFFVTMKNGLYILGITIPKRM